MHLLACSCFLLDKNPTFLKNKYFSLLLSPALSHFLYLFLLPLFSDRLSLSISLNLTLCSVYSPSFLFSIRGGKCDYAPLAHLAHIRSERWQQIVGHSALWAGAKTCFCNLPKSTGRIKKKPLYTVRKIRKKAYRFNA